MQTLIAIPFVPGVEVGLALIAMLGPAIALLVYVATVAGARRRAFWLDA